MSSFGFFYNFLSFMRIYIMLIYRRNSVKILVILLRNIVRKTYSCYHITKDTFHKTKILTLIMKHNNLWVSEKHPKYFIFFLLTTTMQTIKDFLSIFCLSSQILASKIMSKYVRTFEML